MLYNYLMKFMPENLAAVTVVLIYFLLIIATILLAAPESGVFRYMDI